MTSTPRIALAVLPALLAAACGSSGSAPGSSSAVTINGAGSTFAAPMYQQWAAEYQVSADRNITISYQPIGSGAGVSEFAARIVDFGATDSPISTAERSAGQAAQGSGVLQVPMILGAVAVIYHLPGIRHLVLNGQVLAGIYLGKITRWNDPAIAKLNPGVRLPSAVIQPVQRADSSGTSYVLTTYLAASSHIWARRFGISMSPRWPLGLSTTGSGEVAAAVRQTRDSIGYVEFSYAVSAQIPYASLRNPAGKAVPPSTASVEAAASAANYPSDPTRLTFSLADENAPAAYPLSAATYILVPQHPRDPAVGRALRTWLTWCLQPSQQAKVGQLHYAPLPAPLDALALAAVGTISG
jgi:phosphate transport system substrate-binding protein